MKRKIYLTDMERAGGEIIRLRKVNSDLLEACKMALVGAEMMTVEQYKFITNAITKAEKKG